MPLNIVVVMAVYGRIPVTRETIRLLKLQTIRPRTIIIVGDSVEERVLAKESGCLFVQHPNQPLSNKYQAGVREARRLRPDVLVIEGSDSWLSPTWFEFYAPKLGSSCHLIGQSGGLNILIEKGPLRKAYLRRYKERRDPVGAGRLFSRASLDKLDWLLFPDGLNKNLDHASYKRLIQTGLKCKVVDVEVPMLVGAKSAMWDSINRFGKNLKPQFHRVEWLKNPEAYLGKRFPEALESVRRLRAHYWG